MDDIAQMEHEFLKGNRGENLGVYCELFSAKSNIDGQDGGIVTTLLLSGLTKGVFDAAVVVQRKKGYTAKATIAENANEAMAARGTTYLKVRLMPTLKELMGQGKKKIAIVCTPCEVGAARRLQQSLRSDAPDVDITIIGLFCLEAFSRKKLKTELKKLTGTDVDSAEKTQIHNGTFTVQLEGKEYSCKVKDLAKAVEKNCHYCSDFSAMLADISVGSVGSQRGFSTVIVRSDRGQQLMDSLDIIKADAAKEEIIKMSKFKKDRAEKALRPIPKKKTA